MITGIAIKFDAGIVIEIEIEIETELGCEITVQVPKIVIFLTLCLSLLARVAFVRASMLAPS